MGKWATDTGRQFSDQGPGSQWHGKETWPQWWSGGENRRHHSDVNAFQTTNTTSVDKVTEEVEFSYTTGKSELWDDIKGYKHITWPSISLLGTQVTEVRACTTLYRAGQPLTARSWQGDLSTVEWVSHTSEVDPLDGTVHRRENEQSTMTRNNVNSVTDADYCTKQASAKEYILC